MDQIISENLQSSKPRMEQNETLPEKELENLSWRIEWKRDGNFEDAVRTNYKK